jgi:hypothetical protein
MFSKTKEKVVKPIRDAMQMALLALTVALLSLLYALSRAA